MCCCHSNAFTLPMKTLAAFHPRSLGIRPHGASSTITAAVTLITASGGFGNVFNSVRFTYKKQRRKKKDLSWTANWVSVTLSTIKFRWHKYLAVIYGARTKYFPQICLPFLFKIATFPLWNTKVLFHFILFLFNLKYNITYTLHNVFSLIVIF